MVVLKKNRIFNVEFVKKNKQTKLTELGDVMVNLKRCSFRGEEMRNSKFWPWVRILFESKEAQKIGEIQESPEKKVRMGRESKIVSGWKKEQERENRKIAWGMKKKRKMKYRPDQY